MSDYVPTAWVDGVTLVNAARLNHIEQGLDVVDARPAVPVPLQEGKWLTVSGGALVWAPAPSGGSSIDYENAWAAPTAYTPGDVVIHNGVEYLAVNPSTGQTPPAVAASGSPSLVIGIGTSFPASPFDGQEFILVDSVSNPTFSWRFRYIAAKASNKWVFIGGSAKESFIGTGESSSATSNADLATVGPSVTLPRSGDYDCEFGCNISGGASTNVVLYLVLGASTVLVSVSTSLYTSGVNAHNHKTYRAAGRTAGDVLKLQYATAQATPTYSLRYLRVTPVALS